MINLRYNEEEYAKQLLDKGFLSKYKKYELRILGKYYKYQGKKPKEREKLIYEFCEKYIEGFNKVSYFKVVDSVLNYAKSKSNNLIIIKSIPVTKNEIEYVNNVDLEYDYKKILFTIMIQNKINKEISRQKHGVTNDYDLFGGNNRIYKELLETSKLSKGKYKINEIINVIANNELVDVCGKGKIRLSFVSNIEECGNVAFELKTFDDIGYYFDLYNKENKIKQCESCPVLIKARSNRTKYCEVCWKNKEKEIKRETWHKNKKLYRC